MEQSPQSPPTHAQLDPTLFQAMVEQAGDAIIFIDRAGAVRAWNRGAEKIFGYSTAEALANSLDIIIPEHLRKAHWEGFNRAVEAGHTKNGDRVLTTRSVHKDGHKIYVDLQFSVIKDASGAVAGALAIGRDCTKRYLEEKARH